MNDPSAALLRLGDALGSGDRDAVLACFADDADLDLTSDDKRMAVTSIGQAVDTLLTGFTHLKLTPISREVRGSRIVQESVLSGDHTGSFAGEQPTATRVRVNLKLWATVAAAAAATVATSSTDSSDSTDSTNSSIQSLSVEVDTRALFAQIAETDDVVGVTGVLIAAARERHDGSVRIIEAAKPRAAAVALRRAQPRARGWRRQAALLIAAAALLLTVIVVWWPRSTSLAVQATAAHPTKPQPSTGHPTATSRQTARATKTVSATALPVIKIAAPKTVPHVQPGRQVVLNSDVLFGFDSAALTPAARTALTRVASQVRSAGVTGTIQVNGYTDNLGSVAYDLALSRARALAVASVLQKGLAGQAVTLAPQGFGRANPVSSNTSGAGRARNRRVAIVLPTPR